MRVSILGRHLTITNAINDYTEKKVLKLEKYFNRIGDVSVTLSAVKLKTGPSHTAEMITNVNGNVLKAVSTEKILYIAIDKAASILEGQVKKYKSKLRDDSTAESPRTFNFNMDTNEVSTSWTKQIVKVELEAKPMNLEEAILQMETMGKDFYVFFNGDTEEMNVVYKKRDGNYAHIEPRVEK